MKRVTWLTDVHLNFLGYLDLARFLDQVSATQPDVLLLGGDIGEAPTVADYLEMIAGAVECEVYFVLGNHDYYHGGIDQVRRAVEELTRQNPKLCYLTRGGAVELTPNVALVGHDGWGDGRVGDYLRSDVMLNDYRLIDELSGPLTKQGRWPLLKRLGDEAAAHIRQTLPAALETHGEAILLTHVPPFREACWHEGRISDDEWSPHFTCHALGDALLEIMSAYPHRQLTVLCGHTHSSGRAQLAPNLHVLTGRATYAQPEVQKVWEIE